MFWLSIRLRSYFVVRKKVSYFGLRTSYTKVNFLSYFFKKSKKYDRTWPKSYFLRSYFFKIFEVRSYFSEKSYKVRSFFFVLRVRNEIFAKVRYFFYHNFVHWFFSRKFFRILSVFFPCFSIKTSIKTKKYKKLLSIRLKWIRFYS